MESSSGADDGGEAHAGRMSAPPTPPSENTPSSVAAVAPSPESRPTNGKSPTNNTDSHMSASSDVSSARPTHVDEGPQSAIYHPPSASEDDESYALADRSARASRLPASAPATAAAMDSSRPPSLPLSGPAATKLSRRVGQHARVPSSALLSGEASAMSLSSHSHSGEEASAASSRSYLPLQSKTSLYRRQASAASSMSNEHFADEGYPLAHYGPDGTNLNRAKSVSSVSSVNSTSSMEAVPFRAAPLGNVRLGFGGISRASRMTSNRLERNVAGSSSAGSSIVPSSAPILLNSSLDRPSDNEDTAAAAVSASSSDASAATHSAHPTQNARQRLLPKGPSDDWLYRNAPGMGARSRVMPHTIAAIRPSHQRPSISSAFDRADEAEEPDSEASSMHEAQRVKPTIRSKLAKRAGKLGLKPLTSVNSTTFASAVLPLKGILHNDGDGDDRAQVEENDQDSDQFVAPAFRSPADSPFRSTKLYLGPITSIASSSTDGDPVRATSSVTNAPLIVTKSPPGPPGSIPLPSPGLVGKLPFGLAPQPIPRVSPQEEAHTDERQAYFDAISEANKDASQAIAAQTRPGLLPRQGSVGSGLSNIFGAVLGNAANKSASNLSLRPPSQTSSSTAPSPVLTPAQIIQMEVRAGTATVPSEPSGAAPTPADAQEEMSETLASERPIVRRPVSASISSQMTARPNLTVTSQRWSNGAIAPSKAVSLQGNPFRPGFLRALTSDSVGRRSTSSREDARNSDDLRRITESGRKSVARSGSASPRSPSSPTSSKGRNSPSLRRPDATSGLALPSIDGGLSRSSEAARQARARHMQSSSSDSPTNLEPENVQSSATEERRSPSRGERPLVTRIDSNTRPSALPSLAVSSTSSIVINDEPAKATVPADLSDSKLPLSTTPSPRLTPSEAAGQSEKTPKGTVAPARSARVRTDFWFGELIGEGSYSTVVEAWDLVPLREKGAQVPDTMQGSSNNALAAVAGKPSQKIDRSKLKQDGAKVYAIKVLDKVHILKEKKQKYVNVEKEALSLLTRHPGVITLYWTFQDRDSLYFVLEMAPNGELLGIIKRLGSLDLTCARFYGAQLLETIEAVHKAGVLHRDIKPENVLLSADMRIRVADFGSAKVLTKSASTTTAEPTEKAEEPKPRPSSFVGTAEYVSPELLVDKQVSKASDFWAFGCVLFQMLCGRPPFKGASEYQTFQKIMRRDFDFQPDIDESARLLIDQLLTLDPSQRPSVEQIKAHTFFKGVEWDSIWTCPVPELKPGIYRRPADAQQPAKAPQMAFMDDGISYEEEDDRGDGDSLLNSDVNSARGTTTPDRASRRNHSSMDGDDADDDESSLSDAGQGNRMFRNRGLSAGASAMERMLTQASSSARRGSNLISKIAMGKVNTIDGSEGALQVESSTSDSRNDRFNASLATSWAALLLPYESLLYACPILHKTNAGLLRNMSKKRQLLLTDFPRLLCVKETNDQLKVKSEVILGLPRSVAPMLATNQRVSQASPYESSPADRGQTSFELQRGDASAYRVSSKMRRQSSAGPLLPASPSSSGYSGRKVDTDQQQQGFPFDGEAAYARRHSSQMNNAGPQAIVGLQSATDDGKVLPSLVKRLPASSAVESKTGSFGNRPAISSASSFVDVAQASPNMMTSIESKSIRSFIIHTPSQSYLYEDPTGDASHWIKSITIAARRHGAGTAASDFS